MITERALRWLAWHLPREIVYWCGQRLWLHATSGRYSDEHADELQMQEALRRWERPDVASLDERVARLEDLFTLTVPRAWLDTVQLGYVTPIVPPRREATVVPELRFQWLHDRVILEFWINGSIVLGRLPLLYEGASQALESRPVRDNLTAPLSESSDSSAIRSELDPL